MAPCPGLLASSRTDTGSPAHPAPAAGLSPAGCVTCPTPQPRRAGLREGLPWAHCPPCLSRLHRAPPCRQWLDPPGRRTQQRAPSCLLLVMQPAHPHTCRPGNPQAPATMTMRRAARQGAVGPRGHLHMGHPFAFCEMPSLWWSVTQDTVSLLQFAPRVSRPPPQSLSHPRDHSSPFTPIPVALTPPSPPGITSEPPAGLLRGRRPSLPPQPRKTAS